jgi:hypothetical protein
MANVNSDWYGFNVGPNGEVELLVDDGFPSPQIDTTSKEAEMMSVVEAIDLLDGFYGHPEVKPLLPPVCVITKWGMEWLKRALFGDISVKKFTKQMIHDLDVEDKDPVEYLEAHSYTREHVVRQDGRIVKVEKDVRTKSVITKGKRSRFASCIAHQAYNKFGARPMTEANVLVTRRWIQKLLAEPQYGDLRTVDKNIAIDRALFLSFIPTNAFRQMKLAIADKAWQDRVDPKAMLGGLFGKAFMLVRDEVPDSMMLH